MAKNSLNLIQVENTREGIEKLADLLLVAAENITYMQYKLSSQMFGGNSDVIEIQFGDCVEYVGRTIMEADAKRRDELLLRIAKIPFAPLRLVLLRRYFEMQYKNPFLHFQEEIAFRTYVAMSEKRKKTFRYWRSVMILIKHCRRMICRRRVIFSQCVIR